VRDALGRELYSVALASDAELPVVPPHVVVTETTDLKWWQERVHGLEEEVSAAHRRTAVAEEGLEMEQARWHAVARRLVDVETQLAGEREKSAVARSELADARHELADARDEVEHREQQLVDMQMTRAWRLATSYWGLRDRTRKLLGLTT
jgi:chromosome segregation ATPase